MPEILEVQALAERASTACCVVQNGRRWTWRAHPGHGRPTGIWLHAADGTRVSENTVNGNGTYGIHLDDVDGSSDDNVIRGNRVTGNGTLDILDEGSGNCFSKNDYGTSDADPLPPP